MTLTLDLAPDTERRLTELAAKNGATLAAYAKQFWNAKPTAARGCPLAAALEPAEFERCLDELAKGLPPLPALPADFSRADIYGEHP